MNTISNSENFFAGYFVCPYRSSHQMCSIKKVLLKISYSFKSSVKAFKPYHCQKLILNNINKMGMFQRCIQNLSSILDDAFLQRR